MDQGPIHPITKFPLLRPPLWNPTWHPVPCSPPKSIESIGYEREFCDEIATHLLGSSAKFCDHGLVALIDGKGFPNTECGS